MFYVKKPFEDSYRYFAETRFSYIWSDNPDDVAFFATRETAEDIVDSYSMGGMRHDMQVVEFKDYASAKKAAHDMF